MTRTAGSAAAPPPGPAVHGFADRINGRLERRQKVFRTLPRRVYRYTVVILLHPIGQHLFKTPI